MNPLCTYVFALPVIALFQISFLPPTQADRHKQIAAANSHCNLNCLNGGYCSFAKYTDYPRKGDVGYYQSCTCRPGFEGGSCEKVVEDCQPPYYRCHNGAPCEIAENGNLSCDCSAADAKSDLAGYMCRKPVTQACDTLDENNKSFCTNGGVCLSSMTATPKHLVFSEPTVHQGCQCNGVFSGEHCELIKEMPDSSLAEDASRGKNARAKISTSLSLFPLAGILLVLLFVLQKKRQHWGPAEQSWLNGEEEICNIHLGNAVDKHEVQDEDSEIEPDPDGDKREALEENHGDLQSVLEHIDTGAEFITFEDGGESEFV